MFRWLAAALVGFMLSIVPVLAADVRPDAEVQVNLGVEVSNESDLPLTIVGNVTRVDLLRQGDAAAIDARIGRDRRQIGAQYERPIVFSVFNKAMGRIDYLDELLNPATGRRERYTAIMPRVRWCGDAWQSLSYCAGGALRNVRYQLPAVAESLNDSLGSNSFSTTVPLLTGAVTYESLSGALHLPLGFVTAFDAEVTPTSGAGRYAKSTLRHTQFLGINELPIRLKLRVEGARLSSGKRETPLDQRFFGGGFDSVRGYAYKSISPFDSTGVLLGADTRIIGSAELMAQVVELGGIPLVASGFFDAGRWSNHSSDSARVTARSYGVALSLPFKQGLVRLSLAKPLNVGFEKQQFQIEVRANW
jgi:outer membrane protein assembly factor BamA